MSGAVKIHPAADIFPLLEGEAFDALVKDIQDRGQQESCVFYDGQLLDGRNRWRACKQLGISPDECEIDEPGFDPIAYVLSKNLHRRHLDGSQRAMVAARVAAIHEEAARERQKAAGRNGHQGGRGKKKDKTLMANLPQGYEPSEAGTSRDHAGATLNVSGRSVDHAKTVLQKGSPELIAAVESGKVAVSKAASIAKTVPAKEQVAIATSGPKKKTARVTKTPLEHLREWWAKASEVERQSFLRWTKGAA